MISLLVQGDVEGRPYREDEILDLCFFLLIAGLENTAFGIRATLRHLAIEPADRAAVVADSSLVHNLVEQSLRLYSPVTGLCRTATRATEVAGQAIAEGERVLLLFGSANRDPAVFRGRRCIPSRAPGRAPRRLRHRTAPLRRLEPRATRDARRRRGDAADDPRLPPRTRPRSRLVRRDRAERRLGRRRGCPVNVEVDRGMCVGHAQCAAICPAVFGSDELGYAVVKGDGKVAPEHEEGVESAVESCPEQAIHVT